MSLPIFIRETLAYARLHRLWALAYVATLLLPLMLIVARAGIEICSGIIGLAFLWQSFRTRQWAWLRDPFTLLCAASYAWLVLVVTPLAVNPAAGLVDAALWFRLPLMFAALRFWVLAQVEARTTLAYILAMLLTLVAADAVWQFATGVSLSGHPRLESGRLTGPFTNPKVGLYLSKLLVPVAALCAVAALMARHRLALIASGGLAVVGMAAILLSGERAAFITAALACATTLGVMMLSEKRLRLPCLLASSVALAAVVGIYFTNPWVAARSQQALHLMTHFAESDYGVLASAGIEMGREHWLHGVGLRGFRELCPELPYAGVFFRGLHPHNAYIEWFAEAGLMGLLLFVASLAVLLREAVQHIRQNNGLQRLIPAVALGAWVQHFFPLMGMQSAFTNWAALLQCYVLALIFAALPRRKALQAS